MKCERDRFQVGRAAGRKRRMMQELSAAHWHQAAIAGTMEPATDENLTEVFGFPVRIVSTMPPDLIVVERVVPSENAVHRGRTTAQGDPREHHEGQREGSG